jgi:hypothetical protein
MILQFGRGMSKFVDLKTSFSEIRHSHSLTGQCALIFGKAIEFVVDVKEPLQETAKFTLALRLQLRVHSPLAAQSKPGLQWSGESGITEIVLLGRLSR